MFINNAQFYHIQQTILLYGFSIIGIMQKLLSLNYHAHNTSVHQKASRHNCYLILLNVL